VENDLEKFMEEIGVIVPLSFLEEVEDKPQPRVFEFNMPELDENGEPPW